MPIVGSNSKSSLRIIPGSHQWPESEVVRSKEGATMNGLKFNVPGMMSSKKEMKMTVPDPLDNQVLVFSPYLLHGLSENLNRNETRISLEMRFWRDKSTLE
ncbi:MAG: hypothetical protein AAFY41_01560 [Bacteroidota bacterium]